MGEKKASIRTLKTGERVVHHPPDDEFPQGRQVLVPHNVMAGRVREQYQDIKEANAELIDNHLRAVADKKARQDAHPAVPSDKSPI